MVKRLSCLTAIAATVTFGQADPRRIFVTPGDNASPVVTVLTPDPLGPAGNFSASPASFAVFPGLNGSKFYVVARSGSDTLVVVDSSFNVVKRLNFGQNGTAAAITPDRRRLLVTAGSLQIVDTNTDSVVATADCGNNPNDVAVSLDSTRAFCLSSDSQRLTAVDLSTNAVVGTPVNIGGISTGVAVGPNGMLYVSATNLVKEIDPRTMTERGSISLNARPGKLAFTPDGTKAVAVNQTVVTGSGALMFDLTNRTLLGTMPNFNVTFDQIIPVTNTRAIGFSSGACGAGTTGCLFDVALPSLNPAGFPFGGINPLTNIRSIVTSGELTGAKFLYVTTNNPSQPSANAIYQFDLGSNQFLRQIGAAVPPAGLSVAGREFTGTPSDALAYNVNQTLASGAQSLPLVIRAIDASGRPLYAVPVTFSTSAPGVTISNPSVTTNAEGLALTNVSLSGTTTSGTFTVVAAVGSGGLTKTFNFTVGTTSGGTGAGGLSIFAGNGQVLQENNSTNFTNKPLIAVVRDAAGTPISGVAVSFQITLGSGTIFPGPQGTQTGGGAGTQVSMSTDSNGQASVNFLATLISPGTSYAQTTIQASTADQSVNFIMTTVLLNVGGQQAPLPVVQLVTPTLENLAISGRAGDTIPGAVKIRVVVSIGPQGGQGIPNVGVRLNSGDPTLGLPTAACAGAAGDGAILTDATGFATCDVVLGGKVGTGSFSVEVGGFSIIPFQGILLTVTPGAPAVIKIIRGNNQSGNAGQTLPQALVAEVQDAFGNILPGAQVTWEVVTPGTVTLNNVVSVASSNGQVSALPVLGSGAGAVQVRVRSGSAVATFTLTVNVTVARLNSISGGGQTAITGQGFAQPLIVQVLDDKNNPVAGASVSFRVTAGNATLSSATATTNAQGQAQVTITAGAAAGPITVTATVQGAGGTLSQTFQLTSRLPGPGFTAASIVNTFSNQQGVAPLSLATIFATGVASSLRGTLVANLIDGPLPFALGDVQAVTFGNAPAPIFAVANQNGQESVIVQVPGELSAPSTVSVTIRTSGGGSTTVDGVPIRQFSPGLLETADAQGRKFAVVLKADGSFVTPDNPARLGEQLRMLVTGLGPVTPVTATGRAGAGGQTVIAPVVVGLNDSGVQVISAEYAANLVGVYVVTFQVPADAQTGTNRSLAIAVGDPLVFGNGSVLAAVQ